jgi:predicted nucleic acid-binding protein
VTDLVVDASVTIKWVVEKPGTPQALSLRRHRLHAPDLLVAQCANVLWKKVRRNELTAPEALIAAAGGSRADADARLAGVGDPPRDHGWSSGL